MRLWTEALRKRGIEAYFGGTGEGTGFGGGGSYTLRSGEMHSLRFLGLITTSNYQEFDTTWSSRLGRSNLYIEASYQWRPQENFYGLGQASSRDQHTNFALRQTWSGVRYEVFPKKRIRLGAEYKLAWLASLPGRNAYYASPDAYFPDLPGYGYQTRLQSTGAYLNLDGIRNEYQLGGAAHLGASFQDGLGARNLLRYYTYEIQLEGRLPVAPARGVLVGQANLEFNRKNHGSDPIPFYLLPHVGGTSTLRGFRLDRFYGTNLFLLSLEYRYRLHPNIQAVPFFDEGQIFDRSEDLRWLNWHRNYGLGFSYHTARSTVFRIGFGRGKEGLQFYLIFGDRERPSLRGPIRYGAYKR